MVRANIWFRCAAVHDPVSPVLVKPAVIGWRAKFRDVDLVIERPFEGYELLKRMKGWITIDPGKVIQVIEAHGRLKCFDDGRLVVEMESIDDFEALRKELAQQFGDQCDLELISKKNDESEELR